MLKYKVSEYKYEGLTPPLEGEHIGYALFKSGYVNEDLTEVEPKCIWYSLNKESMCDVAKIQCKTGEFYISKIIYSKYGNYTDAEQEYFSL